MFGWAMPDGLLRDAPAYAPRPRELADLELLLSGALAPLTGFLTRADLESMAQQRAPGRRHAVAGEDHAGGAGPDRRRSSTRPTRSSGCSCSTDPEGAPIAALDAVDVWPTREGWCGVGGPVRRIGASTHGSFRRLRLTPAEVDAAAAAGPGARGDRRPPAAPAAAGPDRVRRPHHRRARAHRHPGGRARAGRARAGGAGPHRLRGPGPDAAGHHRRRTADPPGRRGRRRAAAFAGGRGVRGDPPARRRHARCPAAGCARCCRASSATTGGTASGAAPTTSRPGTAGWR